VGDGDITTDNIIPAEAIRKARMVAKADGVVAGLPVAEMVFKKLDPHMIWNVITPEGSKVKNGDVLVEFEGSYRALLTGERTALNFLQRLSGIATMSSIYADAVKDFQTVILDTRKTLPGFNKLDKYAVKTGGASNHRLGLHGGKGRFGPLVRHDFGIDALLAHPSRDQLACVTGSSSSSSCRAPSRSSNRRVASLRMA